MPLRGSLGGGTYSAGRRSSGCSSGSFMRGISSISRPGLYLCGISPGWRRSPADSFAKILETRTKPVTAQLFRLTGNCEGSIKSTRLFVLKEQNISLRIVNTAAFKDNCQHCPELRSCRHYIEATQLGAGSGGTTLFEAQDQSYHHWSRVLRTDGRSPGNISLYQYTRGL